MSASQDEVIYRCKFDNCTRTYKYKFSLNRHMQQHLGVKEHQCDYCGKQFTLAQYLREHVHTHTGDRPFRCSHPGCGKSFRQSGKYSLHKKIHETESKTTYKDLLNEDAEFFMEAMKTMYKQVRNYPVPYFFKTRVLPFSSQMTAKFFLQDYRREKDILKIGNSHL